MVNKLLHCRLFILIWIRNKLYYSTTFNFTKNMCMERSKKLNTLSTKPTWQKTNTNGSKALSSQQMVIHKPYMTPTVSHPPDLLDSSHSCHHGDSEMSNSRPGEWSQTVACVTVKEVVLITGSIVHLLFQVMCGVICYVIKKMTLGKWSSYGLYTDLASLKYFWFGWHLIITDRCVRAGFALNIAGR